MYILNNCVYFIGVENFSYPYIFDCRNNVAPLLENYCFGGMSSSKYSYDSPYVSSDFLSGLQFLDSNLSDFWLTSDSYQGSGIYPEFQYASRGLISCSKKAFRTIDGVQKEYRTDHFLIAVLDRVNISSIFSVLFPDYYEDFLSNFGSSDAFTYFLYENYYLNYMFALYFGFIDTIPAVVNDLVNLKKIKDYNFKQIHNNCSSYINELMAYFRIPLPENKVNKSFFRYQVDEFTKLIGG